MRHTHAIGVRAECNSILNCITLHTIVGISCVPVVSFTARATSGVVRSLTASPIAPIYTSRCANEMLLMQQMANNHFGCFSWRNNPLGEPRAVSMHLIFNSKMILATQQTTSTMIRDAFIEFHFRSRVFFLFSQ